MQILILLWLSVLGSAASIEMAELSTCLMEMPLNVKDRILRALPVRDAVRMSAVNTEWKALSSSPDCVAYFFHHQHGDDCVREAISAGVRDLSTLRQLLALDKWNPKDASLVMRAMGSTGNLDSILAMHQMIRKESDVDAIRCAFLGVAEYGNVSLLQTLIRQFPDFNELSPSATLIRHLMMEIAASRNHFSLLKYLSESTRIFEEGKLLAGVAAVHHNHTDILNLVIPPLDHFRQMEIVKQSLRINNMHAIHTIIGMKFIYMVENIYEHAAEFNNMSVIYMLERRYESEKYPIFKTYALQEAAKAGSLDAVRHIAPKVDSIADHTFITVYGPNRTDIRKMLASFVDEELVELMDAIEAENYQVLQELIDDDAIDDYWDVLSVYLAMENRRDLLNFFDANDYSVASDCEYLILEVLRYNIEMVPHLIRGTWCEPMTLERRSEYGNRYDHYYGDFSAALLFLAGLDGDLMENEHVLKRLHEWPLTFINELNQAIQIAERHGLIDEHSRLIDLRSKSQILQ